MTTTTTTVINQLLLLTLTCFVTMEANVVQMTMSQTQTQWNDSPTIGVFAQSSPSRYQGIGQEYVMSEYIKYLEMAGASVVTIRGLQPKKYYARLFSKINGIFLPGGNAAYKHSAYIRSVQFLYSMAKRANDKGDYFPVWGTCNGFEFMADLAAGKDCMTRVDAENMTMPLVLSPDYKSSHLLGDAPQDIIDILANENVTANFHHYGLSTKTYRRNNNINQLYRVISTNRDRAGVEFVSTMEAFEYPFYAVQWHPEKNIFTRNPTLVIPHTVHARRVAQYMANFFVDQARRNFHKFSSNSEKSKAVVENDSRVYMPQNFIEDFFYNVSKHNNN